jgi:hypothetical protein
LESASNPRSRTNVTDWLGTKKKMTPTKAVSSKKSSAENSQAPYRFEPVSKQGQIRSDSRVRSVGFNSEAVADQPASVIQPQPNTANMVGEAMASESYRAEPNTLMQPPTVVHSQDAGPPVLHGPGQACASPRVPSLCEILPGPYVEGGLLYLRRETYQDETLGVMRFGGLNFAELRSKELDFDYEPGIRVTVGEPIDCGWFLEATFLGFHSWSLETTLSGGTLDQSLTTFPFANFGAQAIGFPSGALTAQQIAFGSRFYSGEGNLKWAVSVLPHSYILVGLRGVNILEKMTVVETGTVGTARDTVQETIGIMNVRAQNPLIGPQIGWDSRYYAPSGRWSIDNHVKAAVLWDLAEVRIDRTMTASPVGPVFSRQREDETSVAGLVDAAAGFTYRIFPNLAIRGGYQLIGVFGYASAALQRPPSVFTALPLDPHTSERAFYHGPYATVEWSWGGTP